MLYLQVLPYKSALLGRRYIKQLQNNPSPHTHITLGCRACRHNSKDGNNEPSQTHWQNPLKQTYCCDSWSHTEGWNRKHNHPVIFFKLLPPLSDHRGIWNQFAFTNSSDSQEAVTSIMKFHSAPFVLKVEAETSETDIWKPGQVKILDTRGKWENMFYSITTRTKWMLVKVIS